MSGTLSSFTAVPQIQERSEATPGLWNRIFSVLSQNLDNLNSDVSQGVKSSVGTAQVVGGFSSNTLRAESGVTVNLVGVALSAQSGIAVSGGPIAASGVAATVGALTATTGTFSGTLLVTGGNEVIVRSTGVKDWSLQGDPTRLLFNETGVANRMQMTAAAFSPVGAGALTLGTASLPWGAAYLTSYDSAGALYNVKAFGLIGDGSTDNATALQTLVNSVNAAGGGTIYFPPGTYRIGYKSSYTDPDGIGISSHSYGVLLPSGAAPVPAIVFSGAGQGLSVLKKLASSAANRDYSMFCANGRTGLTSAYVQFRDLTLDGDGTSFTTTTAQEEYALLLPLATRFTAENCRFTNLYGGGIYLFNSSYARILDSHFEDCDLAGVQNAITMNGGISQGFDNLRLGAHKIKGCTFINNRQIGVSIGGNAGNVALHGVGVEDCDFIVNSSSYSNTVQQHIEMLSPTGLKDITISGCRFWGAEGITPQGQNIAILGNTFRACHSNQEPGNAINFLNSACSQVVINGNTILDAFVSGISCGLGSDILIAENTISDCTLGIFVGTSGTRVRVLENQLTGCTTFYTDNGTTTYLAGLQSTNTDTRSHTLSDKTIALDQVRALSTGTIVSPSHMSIVGIFAGGQIRSITDQPVQLGASSESVLRWVYGTTSQWNSLNTAGGFAGVGIGFAQLASGAPLPSLTSGKGYFYADSTSSVYWVNGSGVSSLVK